MRRVRTCQLLWCCAVVGSLGFAASGCSRQPAPAPPAAEQPKGAAEKGDLKENAEYDAAKESQGLLEAKIAVLEGQIASSRILDESTIDTSKVSILTKVKVVNLNTKKETTYKIVSEKEADLKAGKISITSPIGRGLLGKKVGDTAEVQAPAGVIKFKIEDISI